MLRPMARITTAAACLLLAGGPVFAATAINMESDARTITVMEGGSQYDLTVEPGDSVEFCRKGCFVTLPGGDRRALAGVETIEFSGGGIHIQ